MSTKVVMSWFSAGELASLGKFNVAGLPTTMPGCTGRAQREGWPTREVKGGGGKGGKRTEYLPPSDVLAQIHAFFAANKASREASEEEARSKGISVSRKYLKGKSADPFVTGEDHQKGIKLQEMGHPVEVPAAPEGFVLVPRYDVAASMGHGSVIHSEQVVDHLAFRAEWVRTELGTSPKNLILISAIGDSMEPSLRAGDLLLIDRSVESVRQDAIYAIAHDGELRIKRIQRLIDGSLVIRSDNPVYSAEQLTPDQAELLRIVGRVVWSGRRM